MVKVEVNEKMDLGILAAIVMLLAWAIITFVMNDAPGITHALLTAGVALLVWRIVRRAEQAERGQPPRQ